jgi:hypothetical protein
VELLKFRTYAHIGNRPFYKHRAPQIALQTMEKLNFKLMVVHEQVVVHRQVVLKIIEHGLKQVSEKVVVRE